MAVHVLEREVKGDVKDLRAWYPRRYLIYRPVSRRLVAVADTQEEAYEWCETRAGDAFCIAVPEREQVAAYL